MRARVRVTESDFSLEVKMNKGAQKEKGREWERKLQTNPSGRVCVRVCVCEAEI